MLKIQRFSFLPYLDIKNMRKLLKKDRENKWEY